MAKIERDVIKAYALVNAVKYNGKANQGAVLAGLFAESSTHVRTSRKSVKTELKMCGGQNLMLSSFHISFVTAAMLQ